MLRLLVRNLETTAEAQSDKASGPSGGLMAQRTKCSSLAANCRLGESAAEDPSAQHRCGESVMMNSEGGTSPWWHWLLDLKRIYFAPDLVMPDMLPLGKD